MYVAGRRAALTHLGAFSKEKAPGKPGASLWCQYYVVGYGMMLMYCTKVAIAGES